MTAFCFWDSKGRSIYANDARGRLEMELDGAVYCKIDMQAIPVGYASVPITIDDNGDIFPTRMVAGSVGIRATAYGNQPEATRSQGSIPSRNNGDSPLEKDSSSEDAEEEGSNTLTSSALAALSDRRDAPGQSSMLTTKPVNGAPLLDSIQLDAIQPVPGWWLYEVEP